MDKKFDMMNPDGFSRFNSIIVGVVWGVEPMLCSCSYFYGLEKLKGARYSYTMECTFLISQTATN